MDQALLKICQDPKSNQKGTRIIGDKVYIFASLKKDIDNERLNYKDKFLDSKTFQWESETNTNSVLLNKLLNSKECYLFIRKVSNENGMVLPFIYVGTGILKNMRESDHAGGSYIFDIPLDNELPDDLQYDFGIKSIN